MTGPYAGVLADAPGLDRHPGLVAALASGNASGFQVKVVDNFVSTLELAKQVELAKASGAQLNLAASAKGFLDSIGVDYSSVDAARSVTHPPDPAPAQTHHGFWSSIGHGLATAGNAVVNNPVTRPLFHGLDVAADVALTPVRAGEYGLSRAFGPAAVFGRIIDPGGEGQRGMAERGYDSGSFFSVLSYYSHGERNYADLDPLREQYGDDKVTAAQRYVEAKNSGDAQWFSQMVAGKSPDDAAAALQQINDPQFQELARRVDAAHLSVGRELATGLGIDPVEHSKTFTAVSGSTDAAVSWYADPTLVLGKGYQAVKRGSIGLNGALDAEGVRKILDPANGNMFARQVRRGWETFLVDATMVGSGSVEDSAVALARINARTPELLPLVGDVTGKSRVVGRTVDASGKVGWRTVTGDPFTTMDELTEHLVNTNAMLRLGRGLVAAETPLMPGAVSAWGWRQFKGAAAGAGTRGGLARRGWIDIRDHPEKVIPLPGESAGGILPDDVADTLTSAAGRGQALFNQRKYGRFDAPASRVGRGLAYFSPGAIGARARYAAQRLGNLLPTDTRIDWADPGSTDTVRRFALTYMPKSEANLLTAQYAAADEAARFAIVRGMYVQTAHAAGLGSSVSGRDLLDSMVSDLDGEQKRLYSTTAGADTYANPNIGEAVHAALYPGQLDSGLSVPSFAAMQRAAAKVTIWDYTMRGVLNSGAADTVMSFLKPGWLTSFSNTARNIGEDLVGAALRGQAPAVIRARSAQALRKASTAPPPGAWQAYQAGLAEAGVDAGTKVAGRYVTPALREVLSAEFDDPDEARGLLRRTGGRLAHSTVVRQIRGLKASAHLGITDEETLAALEDWGTDEVQDYVSRLAGDAHRSVLSPGEEDVADQMTAAGYQIRKLNVKLQPAGYDLVPTDGGRGLRAWSYNLTQRFSADGLGHRVLEAVTGPELTAPIGPELADAVRRGGLNGEDLSRLGAAGQLGPLQREYELVRAGAMNRDVFLTYADAVVAHTRAGQAAKQADDRVGRALSRVDTAVPQIADALWKVKRNHAAADGYDSFVSKVDKADPVALKGLRDVLADIAGASRAALDDPKLQKAATRVGPRGGYRPLKRDTGMALTALIGRTGDVDEAVVAIDRRLAALTERGVTGPAARAAWGDPVDRVADYLASPGMEAFRRRAQRAAYTKDGVKVGDDPELLSGALRDLAEDLVPDMTTMVSGADGTPLPELVAYLRDRGRAPTTDFLERLPDRPEHAVAKNWTPIVPDTSTAETVKEGLRALTRGPYRVIVEEPIQKLSRNPIYLVNYVQAKRNLAGYADQLAAGGLERDAAEKIARDAAAHQAFHATVRQVDDPQLRTQMDVVGRNFFSFSRASQDFLRRWGRTFREDPTRIRRAQLVVEGGIHSGFLTKDAQGNLQFTYPGSGAAINALMKAGSALGLPLVALPSVPNLSTKLIYLNAGLDNPIGFTVTPLVSVPASVIGNLVPGHELAKSDLDVIARGQLGAGRPLWESFMPTQARRMWAALGKDERNSQTASAAKNAIVHLDAAGLGPAADATPTQRDNYLQRVKTGVMNQLVARAVFAFFAPGAPGQPEESTPGDDADPFYRAQGIASLKDEFRKMVSDQGYGAALATWTKLHPDKLAFTVGTTATTGANVELPATRGAQQWMQDHAGLLKNYRGVAAYLVPTDPGEFSQSAWQAQLEMGLRGSKSIGEFYNDVRVRGAERTYYDALDVRDKNVNDALAAGDLEGAKAIKAGFTLWSGQFQAANPLFAAKQADFAGRVVRAKNAVTEAREMLADPAVPALPELPGIQAMIDAYATHQRFVAGMKGQRGDDATAARAGETAGFSTYMTRLIGSYPALRDMYNGIFRTLDTDLDYLEAANV